jgi:phosphotriesterase-related protein
MSDLGQRAFELSRPHVMTVLGPIVPDALGRTLHHEHVIARPLDVGGDDPDLLLDDPARSLAELKLAFDAGLRAVVDMTPVDYGRDVRDLRWIAERSRVHVIAVTGHHKDRHAAPYLGEATVEEILARNVRELTEGIDGTDARAGVVKAGTSLDRITPVEERVLRAAARSSLATGAPVSTHTDRGTMALEQLAVLGDEGLDPARVVVGHLDFALEESYLRRVLETGAFVSFDQISKTKYAPDEARAAMVKTLVDAGHAGQLLLSGDLARKSYLVAYGGGPGWRYVVEGFPRLLTAAGLDDETVRRLYVDNPARALTVRGED